MNEAICSLINMQHLRLKRIPSSTAFIFSLIIPLVASSFDSISFDFPPFDSQKIATRSASLDDSGPIQLTIGSPSSGNNYGVGQAIYSEQLHLWDSNTGNLADFTTQFTFIIDSANKSPHADGLAFFLAPVGYQIPENSTGGYLGLTSPAQNTTNSSSVFVAVEFDTFANPWDPQCDHVGVDVNSVASVRNACAQWMDYSILNGRELHANITYNSSTLNLSIVVGDDANNSTSLYYQPINLADHLPEWVCFGFRATAGVYYESHEVTSWKFSSALRVPDKSSKLPSILGIGGACFGLVFALGLAWLYHRSKKNKFHESEECYDVPSIDEEFRQVMGPKKFSYQDLIVATNDFADERLLGEGGFGRVYEGFLEEINSRVAIKRITPESRQGIKEYATEVKTISRLRHRNLVQLIGWCHEKNIFLLMYEYMSNGSLDAHLFKGRTFLTWEKRYQIARDVASALLYLHDGWEQCVVHRDIKCSNIMLDSEFNAKVGDFGLARLVDRSKGSQTTVLAGTWGYMAPECVYTGKASKESDIYSYGIVILEIACGRKAVEPSALEDQVRLLNWVWKLYGTGKLLDAADSKLNGYYNEKQMEQLMIVGLWCSHPDSSARPSIKEAMTALSFDASPPVLPSQMPIPSYLSLPQVSPALSLSIASSSTSGPSIEVSASTSISKQSSCSSSSALILNVH